MKSNKPDKFSDFLVGISDEELEKIKTVDASESVEYRAIIDRVLPWNGLQIGVEYPPGAIKQRNTQKLKSGYGHIRGHKMKCYICPDAMNGEGSDNLFKVKQLNNSGELDEMKAMVGYSDMEAAKAAYLREMPEKYFGGIEPMSVDDLEQYRR